MPYTPMLYHARWVRLLPAFLLVFLFASFLLAGGAGGVRAQGGPISSGQSLPGTLTTSSGRSVARGASYYADRYTFTASAGQIVTLSTTSSLDTYGYVYNPAGTQVASDDDSNGNLNFKIVYTIPASGTYTAEVTTYSQNVTGSYTLTFTAANGAAPTGLSAAGGNGSASLAWAAPAGASSFNVYRGTVSGGPYTKIAANGAVTSYVDMPLTNSTTYYYVVTANYAAGESGYSNQAAATPNTPPAAPIGLTATRGNAQVALSWTASTGAVSYNVYRGVSAGGEAASAVRTGVTGTSVTDSGLTNGTTYYYQVTAVNSGGEGSRSGEASATPLAPPPAPQNVVTRAGPGSASLIWTASPTATSYSVKRGTSSSGPFTLISGGSVTGTSVTDTGLMNGTTYYYVVSASNVMGEGANSYPAVSAIPGSASLPAPFLSASASSGQTYISLNWTSVSGATSYDLYRGAAAAGEGTVPYKVNVTSGTSTSFSDSSLAAGTTYYYQVAAVTANGEGASSNEASATVGSAALAAPTGLKAVAGSQQVALAWNAVTGATSYNLYRYVSGGSWLLYQIGLTVPSYTDTGLTNGTTYTYYVCAVNASGQGSQSGSVSAVPGSAAPATPTGLRAQSGGSTSVSLNWNGVTGASSYNLYRATTAGGEGSVPVATGISGSNTYYTDGGLTGATTYYYRLTTVTASGEGGLSNEASATPGSTALAAPTGLKGVAGNAQATLTWGAVAGATSYNLYRSVGGSYYATLYQPGLTATTFTDTGLTNGTVYSYYVCAVNVNGQGSQSASISLTPGGAALAAPSLSAQSSGSTSVSLSWTSVTGATSYNVYRSTTAGGEGSVPLATGTTSTSYSDSGLTSGTAYYYKVVAVGPAGEGAFSNEASAAPGSTALPAPTLKGTSGATTNALTWSAVAGATSYNLYRSTGGSYYGTLYQQGLTVTTFSDTGLTAGTAYTYYIDAVNISGQGSQSNSVSLTPGSATLAAPVLAASTSGTYISLSWTSVTGATSYNLYRSTTAGGEGSIPYKINVTSGTGTSFSDSGLTTGTTYYYTVVPVGPGGEGMASNEASATVGTAPLVAPILKGVAGATSAALTWNAVAGATSYNLYRSAAGSYYGTLYKQGLTATSFADSGLTTGTAYSYYVNAVNTSGQGAQSNTVSLTPGSTALAAALLSAQSSGTTSISLSWTTVVGAASYNLYRATTAGGEGATPYQTGLTNTSTSDSGLTSGTTYYYQVVAVGSGGEGASSNETSATPGSTALTAPVLKGVAGATSNALTWSVVSGATSYNLYRSTGGSYYGTLYQQGLTATTFSDMGLTASTAYTYYVDAVNTNGQGSQSNSVSLTPGSTALAAPLLTASTSSTYISLSWTSLTGATSYNLYRSITAGGEGSIPYKVNVSSGTATGFSDSGLTAGTTYYYTVVPVGPGGEGAASNEASATVGANPLAAPILKGVAGATSIVLTWNGIAGATSYNLYRSSGGYMGYGGTLYKQGLTSTTFSDTGLAAATAYSYYVSAVNISGQGSQSNTITLTPGSAALAAPLLTASTSTYTTNGLGSISLSWTTVTGATSYNVYRSTTAGGEGNIPYQVSQTGTSYNDSSLTSGTTYYYKVVAIGPGGEGAFSNEASATVGTAPLAVPSSLTAIPASNNGQSIAVAWTAVTGATSYNLYRSTGPVSTYPGYPGAGILYLTGLTGTTYADTNVQYGPTYNYYVCAVNAAGQGTQSNTASATLIGFGVSAGPTSLTVMRGTVAAVTFTVTPSGGFTGPVAFSGTGLPSGVSAWFYPSSSVLALVNRNSNGQITEYQAGMLSQGISGGISTSLYLAAPAGAAPGTYTLMISAVSGNLTNTVPVTVTIQ